MRPPSPATMPLYAGVFLVTFSGLVFEIALTRIFSATIWYHFAFVAISVALLGWGLGGFLLHALGPRLRPSRERAAALTFLYGLSLPLALWLMARRPMSPDRLAWYFLVALVPFLLAGMALSMVFALRREDAGRLYLADLLGAATGAVTVTLLLSRLGGERTPLVAAVAPIAAAGFFSRRFRVPALVAGAALLALGTNGAPERFLRIAGTSTKAMYRHLASTPGTRIVRTGWNAYSRIDAVTGFEAPFLARLYIDADAWTNVLEWDGRVESLGRAVHWFRALPFAVAPKSPRTLVIGPGGGSDVLVALAAGAASVTAVEMNPLMLRFVRGFAERAGNVYDHPRVETVLSEGRTFVRRSTRSFDVILLGFVDSWAAVASGGLSLSENHLYTVEAFAAYLEKLAPDGALVILRWDVDVPRLVSNAVALLGRKEAAGRIAVLLEEREWDPENPPQMAFILKKRPFTPEEAQRLVSSPSVRPVIVPGRHVDEPYAGVLAGRTSLARWEALSPTRVDPVYDDRPFFFANQKPWGLPGSMRRAFLVVLLPITLLCGLLLVRGRPAGQPTRPYVGSVVYFAALGLGFIAVELALLQHLTLLLGHPIFTLSVLLFTLLAAGGVGSGLCARVRPRVACGSAAAIALAYAWLLPRVVPALLVLSLGARVAIAVVLVVPLGVLMGMPFPRGLRATGQGPFPPPPFYWGLNGVFSVVGSMATMVVAVLFGFTVALACGAALYLVAAAASGVLVPSPAPPLGADSPAGDAQGAGGVAIS